MKELKFHQKCLDSYLHSKTLNKLKRKIPDPPEPAEESSSTLARKKLSRNRDRLGNNSRTYLSKNSFNVNIVSPPQIQEGWGRGGGIEILKRYFRRGLSFLRYRKQDGVIYQEGVLSFRGGDFLYFTNLMPLPVEKNILKIRKKSSSRILTLRFCIHNFLSILR